MKYLSKNLLFIIGPSQMKKIFRCTFFSLLLLGLCSCASLHVSNVPYDIEPWRVGVINSQYYLTDIDLVYGINEKQNWRVVIHNIHRGNIIGWSSDKDRFALHLDPDLIDLANQLTPRTSLPTHVYIKWKSKIEGEFYEAEFKITEKIHAAMIKPRTLEGGEKDGDRCYQNDIVFGLLPGGDAKVWLSGCNRYTFVERIASSGGSRSYPDNISFIKKFDERILEYIKKINLGPYDDYMTEVDKVIKYTDYDELKLTQ